MGAAMTWPDIEAAAVLRADREGIDFDMCEPDEMVQRLWDMKSDVDAALGDKALYVRKQKLKEKCWHTGSYRSHDEGCYEYVYEKAWPKDDMSVVDDAEG